MAWPLRFRETVRSAGVLAIIAALSGCAHARPGAEVAGRTLITVLEVATLLHRRELPRAAPVPYTQVVGRVYADEPWGETRVPFQRLVLRARGAPIAEASTDRDGSFRVIGTFGDGLYELTLVSDQFEAQVPIRLEGCRPLTVAVPALRRGTVAVASTPAR